MLYGPNGEEVSSTPVEVKEDPVVAAGKNRWSDLGYLLECYHNFLAAIQSKAKKDYQYENELAFVLAGSPVWSISDSFGDWCKDMEETTVWRLQSLEEKKLQNRPSDVVLLKVFDKIDNPDPYLGKNMSSEDYEIYEFILRKSAEALTRFRRGDYTLEQIVAQE